MIKKLLITGLLLASYANGVLLTPLVEEVCAPEITEQNKISTFTANNTTDNIIGVEVLLQRVVKRVDGKELRVDVKDELEWYPRQFILKPNESKNFRVQLNLKMPEKEYAYRVIVKEHPLNFKKQTEEEVETNKIKTDIKMIFNYEGFLFVRKCSYKYDLKASSYSFNKEKSKMSVKIQNSGKKSIVPSMKLMDIIIKTDNKEYIVQGSFINPKRIYPGDTNSFELDIDTQVLKDLNLKAIKSVEINNKE